jgi:hypothetical protein
MAVNFQRRNIGVLADTPTFEDVGRSSYVDYAAAARNAPPPAVMREAVTEADAAPAALAGPQTPEAMAQYEEAQRAYLARAEEAALRQRQSVKNPLNVVGNAISAVVGTPFRLLENAIGGGNNDLAAPFRPNATAQDRYKQTLADISTARLGLAQKLDGMRASQTQAMTAALTDQSKLRFEAQDILANAAMNASRSANPADSYARSLNRTLQDPRLRPVIEQLGLAEQPWTPDLARELATDDKTITRIDARGKLSNVVVPYQGTVLQTDDQGKVVNTFQQGVPPPVSPNPQTPPTTELPTFTEDDWNNAGGTSGNAGGTFR